MISDSVVNNDLTDLTAVVGAEWRIHEKLREQPLGKSLWLCPQVTNMCYLQQLVVVCSHQSRRHALA